MLHNRSMFKQSIGRQNWLMMNGHYNNKPNKEKLIKLKINKIIYKYRRLSNKKLIKYLINSQVKLLKVY
jgi:hypothetical protein